MNGRESSLLYTIESDDDIEQEEDEDEQDDRNKEVRSQNGTKKSPQSFVFDFDDGQIHSGTSTDDESGDEQDESESITAVDVQSDHVRLMPRGQERIARAAMKAQRLDKNSCKETDDERSDGENEVNEQKFDQYFDKVIDASAVELTDSSSKNMLFTQLSLSRPLLRAIEMSGFVVASQIQAGVIPLALAGRDLCASAETGSGKTAAFVLPCLERLLYRPRDIASTRVLVVTPTRELAMQIHSVFQQLAQFTDVTAVLICGGKKDLRSQETMLRQRPDVVVCTPGRLLDHLRNSASVRLEELDILVLDEADRLLELGFQDEIEQILSLCSATAHSRQTMLFSATMTARVEDLVRLSLKRPVRVQTTQSKINFASRLVQEFVKIRPSSEIAADLEIEATLLAIVCRSFNKKCIVFFEQKRKAHRFCALLQLTGKISAAELHGDISQVQREAALNKFRCGEVDVLVATDVAARGLDITGVQTVLSSEMPRDPSTYVHRVGRTARAGCGGRAITLVSDDRRKVMKDVLKAEGRSLKTAGDFAPQILSRTIPGPVLSHYLEVIRNAEPKLGDHFKQEREKAKLDRLMVEAERAENFLLHAEEIKSRPARTWFQSEGEKKKRKEMNKNTIEERLIAKSSSAELTAEERKVAFAQADNYPLDNSVKEVKHRMSRKKRRRMEALQQEATENAINGEKVPNQSDIENQLEVAVKRKRATSRNLEQQKLEEPIGSKGMRTRIKQKQSSEENLEENTSKRKIKKSDVAVVRRSIAVGGLGNDYLDWGIGVSGNREDSRGMSKKQLKKAVRDKPFTDFDATKQLRKGGKIGSKAFKSKAKYKRRK